MNDETAAKIWAYVNEALLSALALLLLLLFMDLFAIDFNQVSEFMVSQYQWVIGGLVAMLTLEVTLWLYHRATMKDQFRDWLIQERALQTFRFGFNYPIGVTAITLVVVVLFAALKLTQPAQISLFLCVYSLVNVFTMFRNLDAFNELAQDWQRMKRE